MPEGPEVKRCGDVIRHVGLDKKILALKPTSGKLLRDGIRDADKMVGATLTNVRVKGKAIVIETDTPHSIISTLGMSGWWYPSAKQLTPEQAKARAHYNNSEVATGDIILQAEKYTRAQIIFEDGTLLNYSDMRNFGNMSVVDAAAVNTKLAGLGPDLLNEEISMDEWVDRWSTPRNRKRIIGEALLEQSIFCGLGNIYRAEACWLAGVDPFDEVSMLSTDQLHHLLPAAKHVLDVAYRSGSAEDPGTVGYSLKMMEMLLPAQKAITLRQTMMVRMNMDWPEIRDNGYYGRLMVYAQRASPAGESVEKAVLGGRTIWYVPDDK